MKKYVQIREIRGEKKNLHVSRVSRESFDEVKNMLQIREIRGERRRIRGIKNQRYDY